MLSDPQQTDCSSELFWKHFWSILNYVALYDALYEGITQIDIYNRWDGLSELSNPEVFNTLWWY